MNLFKFSFILLACIYTIEAKRNNNYAIFVNASKFWFNFRQTPNVFIFYQYLKSHGVPDENMIVMNPENTVCGCRNNKPGTLSTQDGVYEPNKFEDAKIDFRQNDITLQSIMGYFRNRVDPKIPMNKRLDLDEKSKIFIYINGHGGDFYWKIQDTEAILSYEMGKIFEEFNFKKEYGRILFISDSCSSFTIFDEIEAPNMYMIGSSLIEEFAFSNGRDPVLDTSKTDKFTYYSESYLEKNGETASVQDYFDFFNFDMLGGNPGLKSTFKREQPKNTMLTEFFWGESLSNPQFKCITNCTQEDSISQPKVPDFGLSSKIKQFSLSSIGKVDYGIHYQGLFDGNLAPKRNIPKSKIIRF